MKIPAPSVTTGMAGKRTYVLVKRFDRTEVSSRWRCLHQEDDCQALGIPPSEKYESNQTGIRGPTLRDLFEVTRRHMPPTEVVRLLDIKGLPRIGFLARDSRREFGDTTSSSRSRAARSSGSFTTRPCTALKVRAASTSLPTLFPSSTGSRLSPSSSHQEPSTTWLRPVDRTSGTLTLNAGTLSCLAHHGTPLSERCPT